MTCLGVNIDDHQVSLYYRMLLQLRLPRHRHSTLQGVSIEREILTPHKRSLARCLTALPKVQLHRDRAARSPQMRVGQALLGLLLTTGRALGGGTT